MTRNKNNRTENKNTRNNKAAWLIVSTIDGQQQGEAFTTKREAMAALEGLLARCESDEFEVVKKAAQDDVQHVDVDVRIEPAKKSATDLAREKAEREAAKEAKRKAAEQERERQRECAQNYAAATMTLNDVFRAVNAHKDERIHEDGTTVASLLAEKGLTKLNLKALKAILPDAFMQDGSVCMPTVKCATYESATEDEKNGKPVYYFVVKGKGKDAKRTYKKAQTYGFSRIDLWTPAVLLRLLNAALAYPERQEHYAKRNAEVKAAKQFFIVDEVNDTAMSTKVADKATRTTTYTRIETANVKWAE